ncbi:MAG: hypothetical protein O3C43_03070 [Verrucomicrobia bacterium]|nr:hypothetical protein [Verrucomicrobiota bacterium]MDA1065464.1 hypothetical protein [Verrucomicrobiota bacterium]
MRTTVDIPDSVYRQAKAKAAVKGETFKSYLVNTLRKDLKKGDAEPKKRLKGPLCVNEELLIYDSEGLSKVLEEDDRALLG